MRINLHTDCARGAAGGSGLPFWVYTHAGVAASRERQERAATCSSLASWRASTGSGQEAQAGKGEEVPLLAAVMAKQLLLQVLKKKFGGIFDGLESDKLQVAVWSGNVVLEGLTRYRLSLSYRSKLQLLSSISTVNLFVLLS